MNMVDNYSNLLTYSLLLIVLLIQNPNSDQGFNFFLHISCCPSLLLPLLSLPSLSLPQVPLLFLPPLFIPFLLHHG